MVAMLRNISLILPTLCAACVVPIFMFAGTTGKIAGRVLDAKTRDPLPGANIVVEGTTLGSSTDLQGRYVILNVPPGNYTVTASFIGYKRMQVTDVRISIDFTTTVDFALEEGDIELDVVIVEGERTPLIRKDLTNPVASISAETISELPVTEISQVIGLQAGITVDNDGSIHIRGGHGNEIAYTLNGVNINNPYENSRSVSLATNAVQEVSVSSGTFSAEYGTTLSGVVNFVTKEGGRSLNGGIKYFTGDHVSSHTDLFTNIDDVEPFNAYRVELSLGGPLPMEGLSFYTWGVYNFFGGSLYGVRLYRPEDSYLSREGFPTGDPRRGSVSDPYYFGPFRHPTSDLVGSSSGDGAVVALNWRRSWNVQGNVSYHFSPEAKLKYEAVATNEQRPSTRSYTGVTNYSGTFASRYKPDGRRLLKGEGYFQSLDWTHVLSDKMFYTVKVSHIVDRETDRAFDSPTDSRYLPSFYLQRLGNTTFLTGGTDPFRFYQKTETVGGKADLVAQMFAIHEVKAGLELRSHTVKVESYTLQFQDPAYPSIDPSSSNFFTGLYNFRPFIPTVEGGYVSYSNSPLQAAAYVQDKIELFQSIILNLGLRYDYFEPAGKFNPLITDELALQDTIFLYKNLQDAVKKHMVQPRISLSFPITDQGTIRFSYGHFYQIGNLASLYTNPNFRAPLGTNPRFGNPDVTPQRSVQYEVGLQQGLTDNLKFEVTGYYKDVRDYIFFQTIITPRGDKQYSLLTNLSYANTRGVSFSLLKRRAPGDPFSVSMDYTFQIADGSRTAPEDEIFFSEQTGRLSETFLVPLSFDRSHTITSTVALSEPNDWLVSLIGYLRTGTPYTPEFPSTVVPIPFVQNSDRQPIQWNIDLRVEKFFRIGPIDYSVFLQLDNLFDVQNELDVYTNSGRALFNIEETTNPFRFDNLKSRIARGDVGLIPLEAIGSYYANPANVSQPRLVRVGFSAYF
ncbi:MAG: TonB-dependent receptor [Ignavibacteriales bacterium]|nr:TonB-dependent receptor [Ignavibacteriales bacterium]